MSDPIDPHERIRRLTAEIGAARLKLHELLSRTKRQRVEWENRSRFENLRHDRPASEDDEDS
jgi:hypothetical protein